MRRKDLSWFINLRGFSPWSNTWFYISRPETKQYTKKEATSLAEQKLDEFCKELAEKGVQIIENNVMIVTDGKSCTASGTLKVIEPIGTRRATSITDQPQEAARLRNRMWIMQLP